jgi:hypothetical protein
MEGSLNLDQILMMMNTFVPKFVGHLKRLAILCKDRYVQGFDVSEGWKDETSISGLFLFNNSPPR